MHTNENAKGLLFMFLLCQFPTTSTDTFLKYNIFTICCGSPNIISGFEGGKKCQSRNSGECVASGATREKVGIGYKTDRITNELIGLDIARASCTVALRTELILNRRKKQNKKNHKHKFKIRNSNYL